MSTCTILNLNKEPSKLYDKLVEVFGNEDLALIEYRKVMGPTFRDQFGDWKHNYMNPTSENLSDVGLMDGAEPKVKHDVINDLWFYVDRNGDKMFVDKMKLSEFETFEIDDVVGHLFSRFAKEHEQPNLGEWSGTTSESGLVLDSIDRSIAALRDDIVFSGKHTAEQKQDLLEKVDRVENDRLAFRSELIVAITGLGVKVRERVFDANGKLESEVSEEDKGGGVNIKDSFETSTKQSATVKTKIWLSQIERRVQKDGLSNPIKDGFLQTESFADFDDVWNTLNRILVDTVGYGEGQATADVFDLMIDKLKGFANTKPFLDHVIERLESARKTGDTQMLNEFVQAFSKTTLNYFVTQVNSGEYSVLNATASGSRRQQITGDWMNNFEATWMGEGGVITEDDQQEIKELNVELRDLKKQWGVLAKSAGTNVEAAGYKETMASPEAFEILNNLLSLLDDLGAPGLQLEDISMLVAMNGGVKEHTRAISRIFNATDYAIGEVLKGINDKNQFLDKDGEVPNIFKREKYLLAFADAVGFRETNINETSVLLSQGKTGYAISNPTYITNRVNRWKQESKLASSHYDQHSTEMTTELGNLGNNPDLKNSEWLNYLLAKGEGLSTKGRVKESAKRIDNLTVGLDSSFTTQGRNDSVTNTDITTNDNINANLAQILNSVLGENRKSMFPTIIAADKSRRVLFEGFETTEFGFKIGVDGKLFVPDAALGVSMGYFKDEYNRMRRVMRENKTLDATKQIVHYHGKDGNGTKSQIFPELSRENTDPAFQDFRDAFYNVDTFSDPTHEGLSTSQEDLLREHMRKSISDRVKEHDNTLSNLDGKSTQLMQHYANNSVGLAGDYFMNGLISSVEYTKLFSGDPAYYKNTADLIKRIPATYTDGLQLRLDSSDSLVFNTATIEGVEVASRYIQKIKESVKDKSIADAYDIDKKGKGGVNTTDAQAWITPRRWKFLKEKLGQWSDAHTAVYEKMQKGKTLGTEEAKLAAQPLKGVYFEINDGRPVYLKYSQAVLIPSLVKGTPMEALYDKMTKDANGKPIPDSEAQNEIHEVITIDGVKVGAMAPTRINKDGTTDMLTGDDLVLNPTKLNNRGWKLQQDLPIKRMHETNVGSQIQKNIFEGLDVDGLYDYEGGMDGREIAQSMHNTISALSDMGKDRVRDKFGIDENNVMTDTSKLYNALIEEFKDRGGNDNIVLALQKGFPFDAIPQIKGKVESILMSMISREILKVSTNGGSFIQVSPFGLETVNNFEDKDYSNQHVSKEIQDVYDNNPEISKLGSVKEYSAYLDTIFPDSEIGDVLYHGSSQFGFEEFSKNKLGEYTGAPSAKEGFFFSNSKENSLSAYTANIDKDVSFGDDGSIEGVEGSFGLDEIDMLIEDVESDSNFRNDDHVYQKIDWIKDKPIKYTKHKRSEYGKDVVISEKEYLSAKEDRLSFLKLEKTKLIRKDSKSRVYNILLNSKKLNKFDDKGEHYREQSYFDRIKETKEEGKDGLVIKNTFDPLLNDVYVVFEPEQIHIIGNKKDILGFKKFADKTPSGIIIASKNYNGEGLLPPRIDKKTGKVLPGQAMIPHSAAVELLKKQGIDLAGKKMKDVIHLLDPSALEMITYRIPNQGMSSNDYLEIVAILPDGVGDSIVVYDGLPAKTGSDFDIDKLFAMQNHLVYDPEIGRLEKLAEHNVHLAVKTPGRFKKGVYQEPVMHTQTEIDKMLLENDLVAQYKAVLNSPATYDNMMRSIDGAQLQDDISGKKDANGVRQGGLFPEGTYKNMELFSPLTQLETKRAYLSGKFGVAQTANQLVDHSMNQLLDVRMHTWLGIGNSREETINGKKRRISYFDTETQDGHSIADNLSAFLNAYVDIAKDPYISRANHNAITANTTFMLLRSGAPLKWVNRFIGQPILKELVELQMEQQSITAKSIELKGERASPIDVIMQKYGVAALEQNPSGNTVAKLGEARLEKIIRDPGTATPEDLRQILSAWTFLQEKGKNFGEAVIAAKADTNGPGASNVERLVNKNKIEKVLSEGVILGYGEKFQDTMLGTYTENSINWVGEVMASTNLFWSGNREMRGMYDAISMETGNGPSLVNLDLAKAIESNMYTYLMAGTSVFEGNTNPDAWAYLTRELPKEINNRKTDAGKTTGNAFLDALNIETVKGQVFLGLDSKNKPTKWQNDMYRGWSALYNSYLTNEDGSISEETHPDKLLAVNLARYSFANSGFQNNLAQFFTSLPHQILSDFRVTGEVRDIFNQMAENQGDQNFVDQFQRHNSADSNVVKSLKENQVTGNQLVFAYKPSKFKSKELGSVRKIGKKEVRVFPKFVTRKVSPIDAQGNPLMGPKVDQLYEMFGTIKVEDAEGNDMSVPVYSLTFKMGAKVGKFKRFEYIRGEEALQSNEWVNNVSEEKKLRVDNYKRAAKVKYKKTFKELDGSEFSEAKLAAESNQVLSDMQVLKESLDEVMKLKDINCK